MLVIRNRIIFISIATSVIILLFAETIKENVEHLRNFISAVEIHYNHQANLLDL